MPRKPKRPCAYPGCSILSEDRYCKEHKKKVNRDYDKYSRKQDIRKMYGRCWSRIRKRYVKENPFCEECFKKGLLIPVDEVHHIIPLSAGGTHDSNNLMSLCRSCHTKKHMEIGDRCIRR